MLKNQVNLAEDCETITSFYHEVLTDHNLHPGHRRTLDDANLILDGVNPSCGDRITLHLKVEGNRIVDGAFCGDGCVISQASVDMMLDLVLGRTVSEAKHLYELFQKMIHGKASADEVEELEEAGVLQDIAHMPARVKCALLGWRTMDKLLAENDK